MIYYSQFGQDKFINNLFFKNKRNGFFVDIGAANGIDISNSYFFEKTLNWKGICVEPRLSAFKELVKSRKCICENICLSDKDGEELFREYPEDAGVYSGLTNKYDPKHINKVRSLKISGVSGEKEIPVKTMTFKTLCDKYNVKHIDYCSIDTEGGELDIMKSLGGDITIDCLSIENNYSGPDILKYLESKRFIFVTKIDVDEIYVSGKFRWRAYKFIIYKRLRPIYNGFVPLKIRELIKRAGVTKIFQNYKI